MCACMCTCVCVRAHACVCVCVGSRQSLAGIRHKLPRIHYENLQCVNVLWIARGFDVIFSKIPTKKIAAKLPLLTLEEKRYLVLWTNASFGSNLATYGNG